MCIRDSPEILANALDMLNKGEWQKGLLPERWDGHTAESCLLYTSQTDTGRMCTNCSQPSQSSQVQFKKTWQLHAQKTKEDPLSYEMRPYISTPTRYTFYGFKEEKEITRTPVWRSEEHTSELQSQR